VRSKAPQILAYAGLTGVALLVSPRGEIALSSREATPAEDGIAEVVAARMRRDSSNAVLAFAHPGYASVHAVHVSMGWVFCVVSTFEVSSAGVIERLRRSRNVLALAFSAKRAGSGSAGGRNGSGSPAEAFMFAPVARSPRRD
jgi:hypothetical protein